MGRTGGSFSFCSDWRGAPPLHPLPLPPQPLRLAPGLEDGASDFFALMFAAVNGSAGVESCFLSAYNSRHMCANIACLSLDGFYTSALGEEARRGAAVVHREGVVLCAGEGARARSVGVGMALSEAKAILREEGQYVAYAAERFEAAAERWWGVCAGFSGRVEPRAEARVWVDLGGHPDPAEALGWMTRAVWRETRVAVRAGLAHSGWLAELSEQECDPVAMGVGLCPIEPVGDGGAFLARWPVKHLPLLTEEERVRLDLMGYRRAGQVVDLPERVLAKQFGARWVAVRQIVQGVYREPVRALFPEEAVRLRVRASGPMESRLAISAALERLARRAAEQLRRRDAVARSVWLYLEPEEGEIWRGERTFGKPMAGAAGLRVALEQIVGEVPAVVPEAITLVLPKVRGAARIQQSLTGATAEADKAQAAERVQTRLQAVFGEESVVLGSAVKVPRRVQWERVWTRTIGWA